MNQEIENYLMKAQNYLKDCQILENQGGTADSIVSRAYYAMYYVAKALLLSIGQDAHTHQGIVRAFGLHFVKSNIFSKEMGRSLADMLNKRMTGDYEIDGLILPQEAHNCVLTAQKFFEVGKDFLSNPKSN